MLRDEMIDQYPVVAAPYETKYHGQEKRKAASKFCCWRCCYGDVVTKKEKKGLD